MVEVGFAFCAICFPTLSGAMKIGAVQKVMDGLTSIFSNRSRRSPQRDSCDLSLKETRKSSEASASASFRTHEPQDPDLEMHPLPGIQVTKNIDVENGMAAEDIKKNVTEIRKF
ncbi:hypothetical protein MMC13_006008 [Lambiella insularis]|nr:hypothetical protein [Lambiella insularis]